MPSADSRLTFELLHTDGAARRGRITTPHGTIETPVFMPVGTLASVKSLTTDQLKQLGSSQGGPSELDTGLRSGPEIILNNTYHLMLRPGADLLERLGGVHRFMSWDRAVLSDSGGFQVFSLANIRKVREAGVEFRSHLDGASHFLSPETSVEIQTKMGVDIAMALDECPAYGISHAEVERSMEMTHRWARCSLEARDLLDEQRRAGAGGSPALFGIVQGGIHHDLRRRSVEAIAELPFDGVAIGGVSVGEPKAEMLDVMRFTAPLSRPPARVTSWESGPLRTCWTAWRPGSTCSTASCRRAMPETARSSPARGRSPSRTRSTPPTRVRSIPHAPA